MIPRGRPVLDAAAVAALRGMAKATFENRRRLGLDNDFPPPINSGARRLLWDQAQINAHLAGGPVPQLPTGEHPQDLLSAPEAAEYLGIQYGTLRRYIHENRMPQPADVYGTAHWRRADLKPEAHPRRPGRPARPHDAKSLTG